MPRALPPLLPASNRANDGTSGTLVPFDDQARARLGGRAGAAPAFRLLIAEGQALVRAGVRLVLERDGRIKVVGEASTGEEAIALARRLRPDVVLVDATLPGLGCIQAIARMLPDSGRPPHQYGVADRIGRRELQQALGVDRKSVQPPPEALLDAPGER